MARIHGRRGRIYIGVASDTASAEPIPFLNSWSLNREVDKADVTAFGDTNKVYVAGLPDASGDIGGFYDTETAQLYTAASDGLARKFYIYPDTTDTSKYFFGTAFFDFNIEASATDPASVSGSWSAASSIIKVG